MPPHSGLQQVVQILDEFTSQQTQRIDSLEKNLSSRMDGLEHQLDALKAALPDSFTPRRELTEILTPLQARVQSLEAWKDTHMDWAHQVQLQMMQQLSTVQSQTSKGLDAQALSVEKKAASMQQFTGNQWFQIVLVLVAFVLGLLSRLL